jgi:adenylate cyclase
MSDVFISYARSTAPQAQAVAEALRALGYSVWRDDELPSHRTYSDVIEEQLLAAKAVVVIWSAEAVKSQWVQSEADRAREADKLVQVAVDGARLPMPFDRIQCADLAGWTGDTSAPAWRKVVSSVAALLGDVRTLSTAAAPVAAPHKRSICVLPFSNMSGDLEQEYFSDGISEDIITDLSKISALNVVARNTAFAFKAKTVDIADVAARLKVSHVLEGSVRKAGGRVRITAQLIEGASGHHVWAERYDRDLGDIFALQDEISRAIVMALKLKLLPAERQAIETRGTSSAEAYDLYLMARQIRYETNWEPRGYEMIIRLCERAIAIDPNYAHAWSLLAHAQQGLFVVNGRSGDGVAAAERALQLDPNLAEAHLIRVQRLYNSGHRDEAFRELELALKIDPDSAEVNSRAGQILYTERRFAEARPHFEKALALEERFLTPALMLMATCQALNDADGAKRAAEITLKRAEAILPRDRSNGSTLAAGAAALVYLGQVERAREWMDKALLLDPDNANMRYNFACSLTQNPRDHDRALALLEGALASDPAGTIITAARTDPDFDPLRGDPRFQALMAEAEARSAATAGPTK